MISPETQAVYIRLPCFAPELHFFLRLVASCSKMTMIENHHLTQLHSREEKKGREENISHGTMHSASSWDGECNGFNSHEEVMFYGAVNFKIDYLGCSFPSWSQSRKPEIQSREPFNVSLLVSRWRASCGKECRWSLGAERDPWLRASREMDTSVLKL